ncbi:exported hypothetical protein [metagenome]|uniref:Uncharacterized protein n=1 Tax=metagenome TaxID=256318 RepID=A0A2P2BX68_9ZZZZ
MFANVRLTTLDRCSYLLLFVVLTGVFGMHGLAGHGATPLQFGASSTAVTGVQSAAAVGADEMASLLPAVTAAGPHSDPDGSPDLALVGACLALLIGGLAFLAKWVSRRTRSWRAVDRSTPVRARPSSHHVNAFRPELLAVCRC